MSPPRLATWLLGWLESTSSPLVGDLYEEWQHGRSAGWFWRQTMKALHGRAARHVAEHLPLACLGLAAIGLSWAGAQVPLPGVNTDAPAPATRHGVLGLYRLYDLFTGGNLGRGTVFALGIMPYVSALFIAYLATALGFAGGWGPRGLRRLAWSVRGVALVLGVVQALAIMPPDPRGRLARVRQRQVNRLGISSLHRRERASGTTDARKPGKWSRSRRS